MPVVSDTKESAALALAATDVPLATKADPRSPTNASMDVDADVCASMDETVGEPATSAPAVGATHETKMMEIDVSSADNSTVIIFDWDDTLLSSSYLATQGYRLDTVMPPCEEVDNGLKLLETSVVAVLTLALRYGSVHIITNAETGWVQLSASKFLPGVVPFLSKVQVISARSTYEHVYPDAPVKWKFCAFQSRIDSKESKHVISFGDSHVEREAVRAVTRGMTSVRTKSVKFAERPSMEQLRRQLDLVGNCFQYIHGHDGDLDLMLTLTLVG